MVAAARFELAPPKRLVSKHKLFSGSILRQKPYSGSKFAPLFITLSWRMTIVIPSKTTTFQSNATSDSKNTRRPLLKKSFVSEDHSITTPETS